MKCFCHIYDDYCSLFDKHLTMFCKLNSCRHFENRKLNDRDISMLLYILDIVVDHFMYESLMF